MLNGQFREKIPGLLEIFYGLAIASGLEQVTPGIFGYGGNNAPFPVYQLVWCSLISLSLAVGDWLVYYLYESDYKNPHKLVFDTVFPILLFLLFATSYSLPGFFAALTAYCWIALLYSICYPYLNSHVKVQAWEDYYPKYFRLSRALVITVCLLLYVLIPNFNAIFPLFVATVLITLSWYFIWQQLKKQLA